MAEFKLIRNKLRYKCKGHTGFVSSSYEDQCDRLVKEHVEAHQLQGDTVKVLHIEKG